MTPLYSSEPLPVEFPCVRSSLDDDCMSSAVPARAGGLPLEAWRNENGESSGGGHVLFTSRNGAHLLPTKAELAPRRWLLEWSNQDSALLLSPEPFRSSTRLEAWLGLNIGLEGAACGLHEVHEGWPRDTDSCAGLRRGLGDRRAASTRQIAFGIGDVADMFLVVSRAGARGQIMQRRGEEDEEEEEQQ